MFHTLISAFAWNNYEEIASKQRSLIPEPSFEIVRLLDQTLLQDSWSFRNAFQAREIAKMVIDQKGRLDIPLIEAFIKELDQSLYSLAPNQEVDYFRKMHLKKVLESCLKKDFLNHLQSISKPFQHKAAEQLIKDTLFLAEEVLITDFHARQASLSALLASLRQNVGSCFATAPAILIQQQQMENFLKDINELFSKAELKRVIEGEEYTVPFNTSSGLGDLKRPFTILQLGKNPVETLSQSPGLVLAFEEAGILNPSESFSQKSSQMLPIIEKIDGLLKEGASVLNAETLLLHAMLAHFNLTQSDLEDFKNKPKAHLLGDLIISNYQFYSEKDKIIVEFQKKLELAKRGFRKVTENALLKAWEFTLASFAETKADFCRYHLRISLGFEKEEPFSIGKCIHDLLQEKLKIVEIEIEDVQVKYDHLFAQVKYLEGRVASIKTENELNWVNTEYQIRRLEIDQLLVLRDELIDKADKLARLYGVILKFYDQSFKTFFQEIYDPEMLDVSSNPYDDSPAGFRLLYKHGRASSSSWTIIDTSQQFIEALVSFFVSLEMPLSNLDELKGLNKELTEIVTALVLLVKTSEFLKSALYRMAKAYNVPISENILDNLDKIEKKPWAYVSGGTMATLVASYYKLPQLPKSKERWVENEWELAVFYLDCLRELPLRTQNLFLHQPEKSLLAFSPSHAFLLKPGLERFKEGWWENNSYTYTWVRDHWILPDKRKIEEILLNRRMMEAIVLELSKKVPHGYKTLFRHLLEDSFFSMTPSEFRGYLLRQFSYQNWIFQTPFLALLTEELDSLLFSHLPFFKEQDLWDKLEILFKELPIEIDLNRAKQLFNYFSEELGRYHIISAKMLRELAKTLLMQILGKANISINLPKLILNAMRKNHFALPEPILFADTNWVKNYFGFVVNPGTLQFELWRFDELGQEGRPIGQWKKYLDGTEKLAWGLYVAPWQYE